MMRIFRYCLIAASILRADVWGNDAYTAPFLEIGIDARHCAMGGAGGTLSGRPSSFFWNPSGLAAVTRPTVQFMHNWMYEGFAAHDYVGLALPLNNHTVIAFNGVLQSIPDIPVFPSIREIGKEAPADMEDYLRNLQDNTPPGGYFTAYDMALFVSVAKTFSRKIDLGWQYYIIPVEIPLGINFKVIRQQLGDFGTARGIGADAGAMLRIDARRLFGERDFLGFFNAGLTLQNIGGTVVSWGSHESVIVYDTKFSCGYEQPLPRYHSSLKICYDYDFRSAIPHIGLEVQYHSMLALRFGYNDGSFALGGGLSIFGADIDYAFESQEFGIIHRLSGGYAFGKLK